MPPGGKPKKNDALLKEMREIKFLLRNLLEEEKKDTPPSKWRRALYQFGFGVVKGLGVFVGATIIAGIIFLALNSIIQSIDIQSWITDYFSETIENAFLEAEMPNEN